jgi:hypothetical protein
VNKIRLAVFLLPLALALPFLNRAYFVDDHYFVEIATWLKDNPSLPYHFRADDAGLQNRGWEENGFVRMVNPLAHHYYLALWLKAWQTARGDAAVPEWFLRLGGVLLSCGSALLLFELARRWTFHPVLTTVVAVVTPVFWLSSYSLLIDPTMTFFALAGLFFIVRSVELDSMRRSVLSGALLGLAILTKYPAILMLPLCAIWVALNAPDWKRARRTWPAFVVPLAALLAYSVYTAHLYGRPHILAASERMVHGAAWPKLFSLLVFFAGSLLIPLAAWALAGNRIRAVSGLLGVAMFALLASSTGGFTPVQAAMLAVWLATGLLFFAELTLRAVAATLPFLNGRSYPALLHFVRDNRVDAFLLCWIGGFMLMMVIVMGWVAVRYYCLVAPAVVFLTVRLTERRWPATATRLIGGCAALLFVFTAAVGYADWRQAEPSRAISARLASDGFSGGPRHFYLGDSFTMSYLKDHGWTPAFPETMFRPGDLVLSKDVTMPLMWFFRKHLNGRLIASYEFPSRFPLKVMDFQGSAGFYASVWGALPFTWSLGPWERFRLFEILQEPAHDAS